MNKQSDKSKKAEIKFRKMLVEQQVVGKYIFDDEFDAKGIEKILGYRMKSTLEKMASLKENGMAISPYVEIGAERCQRSLVMENDLNAAGASIDISFDMLKSCDYYKDVFSKSKIPMRICCDIHNLPFMTDSIPFAFCYETLHHFPDPAPVIKEIHRILSPGGHFFFDEEPYRQLLHFNLYKGKKVNSKEALTRGKIEKILDYFFAEKNSNETICGIVENFDISIAAWKHTLGVFSKKEIKLQGNVLDLFLFNADNRIKFFLAYLLGGNIFGICEKEGVNTNSKFSIQDALICPSCNKNKQESKLIRQGIHFSCCKCLSKYPMIEGILFLFSYAEFKELYPDIFTSLNN